MWGHSHGLRYPVTVMAALSGTGTVAAKGVFTVVQPALASTGLVYLTVSSGTNIGTVVGTYSL